MTKYNNMNYIPLFKLSELYLIAAECADGEDAYWYLNQLRNHRGLSSIEHTKDIESYIYQEYRREFLGEGQLFFYYKRKLYDTVAVSYTHLDVYKRQIYEYCSTSINGKGSVGKNRKRFTYG